MGAKYTDKLTAVALADMAFCLFPDDQATNDVDMLLVADAEYGSSWKKRGGVGAFMMLARKWDRIENAVLGDQTVMDIVDLWKKDSREEGVADDVRDLRRYLYLVEADLVARGCAEADVGTYPGVTPPSAKNWVGQKALWEALDAAAKRQGHNILHPTCAVILTHIRRLRCALHLVEQEALGRSHQPKKAPTRKKKKTSARKKGRVATGKSS